MNCEESLSVKSFPGAMCSAIKRVWRTVGRGPKTTSSKEIWMCCVRWCVRVSLPPVRSEQPGVPDPNRVGFRPHFVKKEFDSFLFTIAPPRSVRRVPREGIRKKRKKRSAKKDRAGPTQAKPSQCF